MTTMKKSNDRWIISVLDSVSGKPKVIATPKIIYNDYDAAYKEWERLSKSFPHRTFYLLDLQKHQDIPERLAIFRKISDLDSEIKRYNERLDVSRIPGYVRKGGECACSGKLKSPPNPIQEKYTMSTKVHTTTFINGVAVENWGVDDLIDQVRKIEGNIKGLQAISTESKTVKALVKREEKALTEVVAVLDSKKVE